MISSTIIRTAIFILLVIGSTTALANEQAADNEPASDAFTDLNLRFSNRPLTPPENLIIQSIPLTGLSVARPFVAPAPQAVIFEDDQRQRLAILSITQPGHLTLYLLESLPLDPALPTLFQCAHQRGCQTDRTPLTGGLGCVAFCLKELLEETTSNPLPR